MFNRYWFQPRSFGIGATPSSWEGWALTAAVALAAAGSTFAVHFRRDAPSMTEWALWLAFILALLFGFTFASWWKTDGGWRWRP